MSILTILCLHFFLNNSFICNNCLKKSGKTKKDNKFSAKSKQCTIIFCHGALMICELTLTHNFKGLQSTKLGTYIEDRVNKYLKRQNHPEAGEVFVRVVASSDKTVEIKPGMKSRYRIFLLLYISHKLE